MKGFWKKAVPLVLSGAMLLSVAGCSAGSDVYEAYDYTVKHSSSDDVLHFYSSSNEMNAFLNEYFERHMRYTDKRIHSFPVGAGQPVWKEWESMIGSFWDASAENLTSYYATNEWVEQWLTFDYMSVQDRQGYVSTSTGITTTDWGQGWAFPSYEYNNVDGYGEEFDGDTGDWTGGDTTAVSYIEEEADGTDSDDGMEGYLFAETQYATDTIEILSPSIRSGKGTTAFYAPFLHFSWKFEVTDGDPEDIDDLYVYFQTSGDPTWSEDKCVAYSEYATIANDFAEFNGEWQGTFLNMYLTDTWGRDYTNKTKITQLKFVLKTKDSARIEGNMQFNFIRADFDDRMSDNCGQYIAAAQRYLSYTQDAELLEKVLPNARRAMQFYLTCLDGEENGIISNSYFVGHFNCGTAATGIGIGDGYWDAISFPNTNLYSNLSFHQALSGMLYLEEMAESLGVESETVSIVGKDMQTEVEYTETASSLAEKLELCESTMRETFWDDEKSRFFAGYYDTEDGTGVTEEKMDYGFLMYNLQAVADGIADEEQAELILSWADGERIIEGDTSTGEDIYAYEFAPRFSTKDNTTDSTWTVGQTTGWECGVRNGGVVMQTSYYDLLARALTNGTEDAYGRLTEIKDWYLDVRDAGGEGTEFYRVYYEALGIGMQGNYDSDGDGVADGDTEGPIGIDCEFLEAALLFVSVPDVFFGMDPAADGTMVVQPRMPDALDYWRMENLLFGGVSYDLSIGEYFVQVSNITEDSSLTLEVRLEKPSFKFKVTYNGETVSYTEEDGYIVVQVPFENGKVEIVGK